MAKKVPMAKKAMEVGGEKPLLRMPRRTAVVALNGDYKGFEVTAWMNVPYQTWVDRQEGKINDEELLSVLILDWNLVDFDGNPMPIPKDGGFGQVPIDLIRIIDLAVSEKFKEVMQPPKASDEESNNT